MRGGGRHRLAKRAGSRSAVHADAIVCDFKEVARSRLFQSTSAISILWMSVMSMEAAFIVRLRETKWHGGERGH